MKYTHAKVKAIKADIAKKEISVSFTVDMTQENLDISSRLSDYIDPEAGTVVLDIFPRQLNLNLSTSVEIKSFEVSSASA